MNARAQIGFGIGNVITAALLGFARAALPVRYWPLDSALVAVAVVLSASSLVMFANLRWARLSLRIAAYALLALGLLALTVALLTIAFLSGVHGRWLEAGLPLTAFALALLVPYTIAYPVLQLVCVQRASGEVEA